MNEVTITLTLSAADSIKVIEYARSLGETADDVEHDHTDYGRHHHAIKKARGKASDHKCACGRQAEHWAYLHTGVDESHCPGCGIVSSADVNSYEPMCMRCHKRYDLGVAREASEEPHWGREAIAYIDANPGVSFATSDIRSALHLRGVEISRQTLSSFLAYQAQADVIRCNDAGGHARRYSSLSPA